MEVSFSEADLKSFEDMMARGIARGIVSAVRSLMKDGLISPAIGALQQALNGEVPSPAVAPIPTPPPEAVPQFGKFIQRPEPPTTAGKKTRTTLAKLLKVVEHRPDGYITTDRAHEIIDHQFATQTLRAWIVEGSVKALVVSSLKPPTKGLHGRLVIETKSLRERNNKRLENLKLPQFRHLARGQEQASAAV